MESKLVRPLLQDRVDVIGDVHGEIDALRSLLRHLGCDIERARVERPLVFVGDLVDRGPDSVAVVELVRHLLSEGVAQLVLGNHEYNLLLGHRKEGNAWFFGRDNEHEDGFHGPDGRRIRFDSRETSPREREEIRAFLTSQPLALESSDLRVVHAAWDHEAIAAARSTPDLASIMQLKAATPTEDEPLLDAPTEAMFEDRSRPIAFSPALARQQMREQNSRPGKVLTSGPEAPVQPGAAPRYVGGRWRLLDRDRWWQRDGDDRRVVFGHYWRRRPGAPRGVASDPLYGLDPLAWFGDRGQAFCVDYSVGLRYRFRHSGEDPHVNCGLAALRLPERVLVFDDDPTRLPTRQPSVA